MEVSSDNESKIKFKLNGEHWTATRLALFEWLNRHQPGLAELYHGCIVLIYEADVPGRGVFICHAVREIRNRLPEIVSGTTTGGTFQFTNELDAIAPEWLRETSTIAINGSTKEDLLPQGSFGISQAMFRKIDQIMRAHMAVRKKPDETARLLFESGTDRPGQTSNLAPLIDQWTSVTRWFQGQAHWSKERTDSNLDWTTLQKNFDLFERTLSALAQEFYATAGGLDEILENANS